MSMRAALGLYLYLDHRERQDRHEEWRDRTLSNISRWEDSTDNIEEMIEKSKGNIARNTEKLNKAQDFLNRMSSGKTSSWYDKTTEFISVCKNPDKVSDAQSKINEHDEKVSNCEESIARLEEWIRNDNRKIYDLESKLRSLYQKISDCRNKL